MSLSPKNLSVIQKAGQAVHGACEAIAETVRTQAESMLASVASQPFGVESEQSIARFKVLSRLNHGLVAVEAQLQELYAVAMELANPASDVIALPTTSRRQASNAAAVDVVAKPAKSAKASKAAKKPNTGGRKAAALTVNDTKLLKYLQTVLKAEDWTTQTGNTMATGAEMPLGSVGVSLKKLLESGAVKAGARGEYRLGNAGAVASAPASASAEKARPVVQKKTKVVKTEALSDVPSATVAQAAKTMSVKKTKAAPVGKAKAVVPRKGKPSKVPTSPSLPPSEAEVALV